IRLAARQRVVVVEADDQVRAVATDRGRDVTPERQPVLDDSVLMIKELDIRDADDLGAGPLLGLPDLRSLRRRRAVDPRLALAGQQVAHRLAGPGPARHRPSRGEL